MTVTDIQFSSNSKLIAFSCDDSSNGVLNTMSHKVEHCFFDLDKNYPCVSTSISLNDNLVAAGSQDGTLVCRSLKDKTIILTDKSVKAQITLVRFSPTSNKTLAVAYNSGNIALWDMH